MISISGSPIGGENPPHDKRWRERVAEHCAEFAPSGSVALSFRVEPHRRVDLDNLIRPALAGLRDAGIFTWGYRNLDLLVAATQPTDSPGLDIVLDDAGVFVNVPKLVVGEMPWREPPTVEARREKVGHTAGEVDRLYGAMSPTADRQVP